MPEFPDDPGGARRTGSVRLALELMQGAMSPAERLVSYHILKTPGVADLNIAQLALATEVSEATVTRMCKRIGFAGFYDFRLALLREGGSGELQSAVTGEISHGDELTSVIDKTAQIYSRVIMDTAGLLEARTVEAVCRYLKEAGRVMLYGFGGSFSVASDVAHKLMKLGITALAQGDPDLIAITSAHSKPGDVLIAISHTGRTRAVVEALQRGHASGARTIAVTHDPASPVAASADLVLLTAARPTGLSTSEVSGRIGQLLVFDVIYTALALGDESRSVDRVTQEFQKGRMG